MAQVMKKSLGIEEEDWKGYFNSTISSESKHHITKYAIAVKVSGFPQKPLILDTWQAVRLSTADIRK